AQHRFSTLSLHGALPICAIAYGRFSPGDDVPLFHPCVPETRDRTRLDYAMNTSNAHNLFRYVMPKASYKVSRQDSSMTSPQSPRSEEHTSELQSRENLVC